MKSSQSYKVNKEVYLFMRYSEGEITPKLVLSNDIHKAIEEYCKEEDIPLSSLDKTHGIEYSVESRQASIEYLNERGENLFIIDLNNTEALNK